MTKDHFRALCEQVLVPRLGDMFYRYFTSLEEDFDAINNELIRLNKGLEALAKKLEHTDRP